MDKTGASKKSSLDKKIVSKKSLLEDFNMIKLRQLNELRKENEFCDLILKSKDGFEIKVHKNVLSSASNYFKDLLTVSMKGKFEDSILLLDSITADVLEKIITFIYTTEFEEEIEDIEKIIKYAAIFQLEQLVEICSQVLRESINDNTWVKYWRLGRVNLIHSLEDECMSYIIGKADNLSENLLMSDLTIEEIRSLLADNRLHLQCDKKKIFEHVWKWADDKFSEIKTFCDSEIADLLNISKLEKEKVLGNEDKLANAELFKKVAKLTKPNFRDEVAKRYTFHKPAQRLFGLTSQKMYIGLGEESTIEKNVSFQQRLFKYTSFDNKLLICGGLKGNTITNICAFFDPKTQLWKKFPSMKTGRYQHQCTYLNNKIYACGGSRSKNVEIFDLSKEEWDYGPEMLTMTDSGEFGLTELNGALYAIGGGNIYLHSNVTFLDPRKQKWDVVCSDFPLCFNPTFVRCVSIDPYIYCFTINKRYIFDTRSNQFTEGIDCNDFDYFNLCELDGYIYGLGYKSECNKRSLNLVQYHLDGKQGYKKFYGTYSLDESTVPAIVTLY